MVDELKKNGVDISKGTVSLDRGFRKRRMLKIESMGLVQPIVGSANRIVFDSQHTTNKQLALVRNETSPVSADSSVNNAFDFAGKVRDFYKTVLNWNSIDNNGLDMILNVWIFPLGQASCQRSFSRSFQTRGPTGGPTV